ncbi:MAG: hypothetical protein GXO69_07670 [Acidobacteria bacterium]|nr:hypothetical protein [Acidobacteriota bacterium]
MKTKLYVFAAVVLMQFAGAPWSLVQAGQSVGKNYVLPHIPTERSTWDCLLIVDNLQGNEASFVLELFNEAGRSVFTDNFPLPGFGYSEINLFDSRFPDSVTGMIRVSDGATLSFRVVYRNRIDGGVAEFRLTEVTAPILAFNFGTYNRALTWKGLALVNTSDQSATVRFSAVDGSVRVLGSFSRDVPGHSRMAFVLNDGNAFGPDFPWDQCVRVYASAPVSLAGLNISGIQNKKLLFTEAEPATEVPWGTGGGDPASAYVVIAWNDLGMHCYDDDFSTFSILPPYNVLWAQVVRRGASPEIVTDGVTVSYSFENNTTSVGKTNFWNYADKLFGFQLAQDVGLKGKRLEDVMDRASDHFIAEGIPLTQFNDDGTVNYYQTAVVTAKDASGNILAQTRTIVPVSNEMHCSNCHEDNGVKGIATGFYRTNILSLHDREEGTHLMDNRPVLCASCHSSNALGTTGNQDDLSHVIHRKHKDKVPAGIDGCYNCHPGPSTQCLRGAMFQAGQECTDCHGTMADVGNGSRRPWLDEPNCGDCHEYGTPAGQLYRMSTGHGGMYCESCHGSTHAILASGYAGDNEQNILLQGKPGALGNCSVCHTDGRTGSNPHTASPHPDGWEKSHGDYVENNGYASCARCHGADYRGGTSGVSCYQCHNGPGGDD